VALACEDGYELSTFLRVEEFVDQPSNCQLLMKDLSPLRVLKLLLYCIFVVFIICDSTIDDAVS
jgi:hypothetical protein